MKTLFTKLEFHYSFLIMALGLVLTGYFSNLIVFTSLIIVHEFGHVLVALVLKYKVSNIIIYPFGGIVKLNTIVNTSIYKDLLISISGIVMQILYFFLIYILYKTGIIRDYIYNLFILYHNSMLIFNLLPIIPLDGFKIVNLLLSKFLTFNLANKLSVVISLISIVIFLFSGLFEKNYSIVLILGVLMKNIYKFYNDISLIYTKFLVERYLYKIKYNGTKVIDNENKMYKNKSHFFILNGRLIGEKAYLANFFQKIN